MAYWDVIHYEAYEGDSTVFSGTTKEVLDFIKHLSDRIDYTIRPCTEEYEPWEFEAKYGGADD